MKKLLGLLPCAIVPLSIYTGIGWAETAGPVGRAPSIIASDTKAAGRCVQTLLFALGYYDSEIDGSIGKQSKRSAESYVVVTPFSTPVEALSQTTAYDWCNQLIVDNPELNILVDVELASYIFNRDSKILISEEKSNDLSLVLQGTSSEVVFNTLLDLGRKDSGVLTRQNYDRSVIYVVGSGVSAGTKISTAWGFRLNPDEPWYREEYDYTVSDFNPIEPLILINDVFASNAGEFLFEVYVNGKKLAERTVYVK